MAKKCPAHHEPEKRDYACEKNQEEEQDPKRKKKRAMRNRARRRFMREGRVHKGDGKDVNHKDGNPMNNKDDNLEAIAASTNRAEASDSLKKKRNEALGNSVKA